MANNTLIGALRVEASLDAGKFVDGAKKIQLQSKQTETVVKKSFGGLGDSIKGGIAGFVGALSVGIFTQLIKNGLQYAASIGEISKQLGVTTQDLQGFRYAASQVGVSQQQLETGLQHLTETLGKVAAGAAQPTKALAAIGLTAKDVANIDTGEAFRKIADGLAKVNDRSQRAAVELALFGESGSRLDDLLSGGSDAVNNLTNAAQRLGIVLSDQQIQKADQTADKLEALKTVLQANIAGAVADNADAILTLGNALASLVGSMGQAIQGWRQMVAEFKGGLPRAALGSILGGVGGALQGYSQGSDEAARQLQISREMDRIRANGLFPGQNNRKSTGSIPQFLARPPRAPRVARRRGSGGSRQAPRDRSDDVEFQFQREQQQADMEILRAKQQLAGSSEQRATLELKIITLEHDMQDAEINDRVRRAQRDAAEGKITQGALQQVEAQADILRQKNDEKAQLETQAFTEEQITRQAQAQFEAGDQQRRFALDNLHAADQLATTAADHRRIQLQILDAEMEQKRLQLEKNKLDAIRNGATKEEIANIQAQIDNLPQERANSAAGVIQNTKSPLDQWASQVPHTAAEINEALQSIEVKGIDGLTDALTGVITGTESLKSAFHNLAASILADLIQMTIKMMIFKALQAAFGGGGIGAPDLGASMSTSFSGVASSLPGGFATGGFVSGPGTPTSDSIPAMLSNGEFVINAKSTKRFRPFLEKLNQGSLHLAAGGLVVPRAPITQRMAANDTGAMSHSTVHQSFDLRGAVMTEDLMRQMDAKATAAAHQGAQMGFERVIDMNKRTFGKGLAK